jgi:hypothetical protein
VAQVLTLKAKGRYTHPNQLGEVPEGALTEATNVVIDRESQPEYRRGFATYGASAVSGTGNQFFSYRSTLFLHHGSTISRDNGSGTFTDYSTTVGAPSSTNRVRAAEASKNLYLTTSTGVQKLDAITGTTLASAGMPTGLDITLTRVGAVGGWFLNGNQVAYRVVWGIKDANTNVILGAPSGRAILANSTTDSTVTVAFTIPSSITTSHFYQIYRSKLSLSASTVADDELFLVYENNPTAGEITAKAVSYSDTLADALRATGAPLYTNASQEGINQSNYEPPLCADLCAYRDALFFANTTSKHTLKFNLISAGSPGLQLNDTVTLAGVTYTAKAAETVASNEFKLDTSGSPGDNIANTAISLCRVVNQSASNTLVYAYYISGYNGLPGQIKVQERGIGGSSFTVASSRGSAWDPTLTSAQTSTNDQAKNRIYFSKPQEPESVPLVNYLTVGSADQDILRILALRDSIFVLKKDGIYRITGEDSASFRVSLFDSTATLKAPESCAVGNNQVFCYTDQGVAAVSDNGVQVMSRAIESEIVTLSNAAHASFSTATFGTFSEPDRKYILWTVNNSTDTYATQQHVYNTFTDSWTRWDRTATAAFVNPADSKVYYADPVTGYVYRERRNFDSTDYADEEFAVTVVSSSGTAVVLASTTNVLAGYTLKQGDRVAVVATVVDATHLTTEVTQAWAAGAATAYKPISAALTYAPIHAGNPGMLKQFRELTLFFANASFSELDVKFTSNFSGSVETTTITPVTLGPWGSFPWGSVAWGGGAAAVQPIRTYVPLEKQRCYWLTIQLKLSQAFKNFGLAGISMPFNLVSSRMR